MSLADYIARLTERKATEPTAGNKSRRWNPYLLGMVVLLLVLNAVFFPVIWGDRTLMTASNISSIMPYGSYYDNQPRPLSPRGRDLGASAWEFEPYFQIIHNKMVNEGVFPLWNQFGGFGSPLFANMQSQILCLFALPVHLFTSPLTIDLYFIGRLFLAGTFMFLFLSRFLPWIPAILGGATFMLTGCFIHCLYWTEISVSLTLPLLLLASELLMTKTTAARIAFMSAAVATSLLAGMPEMTFVVILFAVAYGLARLFVSIKGTKDRLNKCGTFAGSYIAGFALAAPQLLTFAEYVQNSSCIHKPGSHGGWIAGLNYDTKWNLTILAYLLPLLYGTFTEPTAPGLLQLNGVRSWWGIVVTLLASYAVFDAIATMSASFFQRVLYVPWWSKAGVPTSLMRRGPSTLHWISLFFATSTVVLLLKRFGSPLVNWVGYLPIFNMVNFPRFLEPALAASMVTLAGIGLYGLMRRPSATKSVVFTSFVYITVVGVLAQMAYSKFVKLGLPTEQMTQQLIYGAVVSALAIILAIICVSTKRTGRRAAAFGLVLLACGELFTSFIQPTFYGKNPLASRQSNAFRGAPYIDFIQANKKDYERTFGLGDVLHPRWNGVFGIQDLRDEDAILPKTYLPFIRYMFTGSTETEGSVRRFNLADRFVGTESAVCRSVPGLYSDSSPMLRLLQLSSVRYILSTGEFELTPLMQALITNNAQSLSDGFKQSSFTIDGVRKAIILQHPGPVTKPVSPMRLEVVVPSETPFLSFYTALDPPALGGQSDGVNFLIYVETGEGKKQVFEYKLLAEGEDAKHWQYHFVDLSKFSGQKVALLLHTDPGPNGNHSADLSGWADIQWTPPGIKSNTIAPTDPNHLQKVYDKEVVIHKLDNTLPRAAIFSNVRIVTDENEALSLLRNSGMDILSEAVVLSENGAPHVPPSAKAGPAVPAQIEHYGSQYVSINLPQHGGGLLQFNDLAYPGWKAYIDGKETPIVRSNYAFRGVWLTDRARKVEFRYEPWTFTLGLWISGLTMLGLLALFVLEKSRTTSGTS